MKSLKDGRVFNARHWCRLRAEIGELVAAIPIVILVRAVPGAQTPSAPTRTTIKRIVVR